jgi:hypothetical protein
MNITQLKQLIIEVLRDNDGIPCATPDLHPRILPLVSYVGLSRKVTTLLSTEGLFPVNATPIACHRSRIRGFGPAAAWCSRNGSSSWRWSIYHHHHLSKTAQLLPWLDLPSTRLWKSQEEIRGYYNI